MDNSDPVLCPMEKKILAVITDWEIKKPQDEESRKGDTDHAYEIFQSITKPENPEDQ